MLSIVQYFIFSLSSKILIFYQLSMSSMRPNRREIYRYNAPWPLFAMGWSQGPAAGRDSAFRLALGMCYLQVQLRVWRGFISFRNL